MTKHLSLRVVSAFALLLFTGAALHAESSFPTQCYENDCSPCDPCEAVSCNPCDEVEKDFRCDPCDPVSLFGKQNACRRKKSLFDSIEVYGWIQGGVYANSRGNTTKRYRADDYKGREVSHFVETSGNGSPLQTLHSTDIQANQVWLGVKKEADGSHGFDWGFALEGYFGPEGWFGQSWGDAKFDYGWKDGDYYTSIPQVYVQLAFGDLSVKLGKFETLLGAESLRAPDFFFYSHSYMYNFMEPYSHSGALFEYTPDDKLYIAAAYTTGADTSLENKYDDHGFLGMIAYQLTDRINLSYALMWNRNGGGVYPNGDVRDHSKTNVYLHTVAATVALTKKLEYSFQWNYGDTKYRGLVGHDYSYGIGNTLIYRFNDHWGVGFRTDWVRGVFEGDMSEYTLGLNWTPYSNLSVRPEIRYDYGASKTAKNFNDGKNRDQFSGGVCGVVSF